MNTRRYILIGLATTFLISACKPILSDLRFSPDSGPKTKRAKVKRPRLAFASAGDFSEGLAPVESGGRFGFIDTTGAFRVPPRFGFAEGLSQNRAPVLVDGLWGYMDATGRLAIPAVFAWAGPFREGRAPIADSLGYAFIDTNGVPVGDAHYEDVRPYAGGLAAVKTGGDEDGAWGFVDRRGAGAIPALFAYVMDGFSGGLAAVRVGSEPPYRTGYIDGSGGFAIDTLYDAAGDFSEGLASVGRGEWNGDRFHGIWGYVDSTGRLALPLRYSWASPFRHGRALVRTAGGGYAYIGRDGSILVDFPKRMEIRADTGSGLIMYRVRGRSGFLDGSGRIVIPARFLASGPFRLGLARVRPNDGSGTWSFIDARGAYLGGVMEDTSHLGYLRIPNRKQRQ